MKYKIKPEFKFTYKYWGLGVAIGIHGPWAYDIVYVQAHILCFFFSASLAKEPT